MPARLNLLASATNPTPRHSVDSAHSASCCSGPPRLRSERQIGARPFVRVSSPDDDRATHAATVLVELRRNLGDANVDLERLDVVGGEVIEYAAVRQSVNKHRRITRPRAVTSRHHDLAPRSAAHRHQTNPGDRANDVRPRASTLLVDLGACDKRAARRRTPALEL